MLANNHTGLNQRWIDNQRIVYRHHTTTQKHTKVININGTVVQNWSSLQGVVPIGYSGGINKIVGGRRAGDGGPLSDVWLLDPDTGAASKILDTSALMPWQGMLGGVPADWRLWHRYFSKGGGLIWIKIEAPNGSFGFTFNTSGANIIHFNSHPGHATWWDSTRIITNRPGGLVAIRNRNGSLVQDLVAGKTNHIALSPDRTLICSDFSGGRPATG